MLKSAARPRETTRFIYPLRKGWVLIRISRVGARGQEALKPLIFMAHPQRAGGTGVRNTTGAAPMYLWGVVPVDFGGPVLSGTQGM